MTISSNRPRLTEQHELILQQASAHDEGAVVLPTDMTKDEVRRTLRSLIRRRLVKRNRSTTNGKEASYRITAQGRDALIMTPAAAGATAQATKASTPPLMPAKAKPGTKTQQVIDLIRRPAGASVDELCQATGWLPHTVRAVLSGLRKKGLTITCTRVNGGVSRYRRLGDESA